MKNDSGGSGQLSATSEAAEATKDELDLVDCPKESCGEIILLTDLESHLSLHDIEENKVEDDAIQDSNPSKRGRTTDSESEASFDTRLPPALRNLGGGYGHLKSSSSSDRQFSARAAWRELLNMPSSRHEARASPNPRKLHRRPGVSSSFFFLFSTFFSPS